MEDKGKNLKLDLYNISGTTGLGTLGIYYSKAGKVKRFPSSVKIHKDNWEKKNREVKKGGISDTDKAIVDTIYYRLQKIITDHQFQFNELPAVEHITEKLDKPTDLSTDIHKLYAEFLEDYVKPLSTSKQDLYRFTGQFLKDTDKRNKYNLNLHNFNYNFIQKFKAYLQDVRGNQNSTINIRIGDLITFVGWLDRREIKHSIKTQLWQKMEDNSVEDFTCLERKELEAIMAYVPNEKKEQSRVREQKTKDIIVFLSHTGMRIGEIRYLKKHNFDFEKNEINFIPRKTRRKKIRAIIPITRPVREILERYNYELPTFAERFVNPYIRMLCEKIDILHELIEHNKIVNGKQVTEMVPKYSILDSHAVGRKTFINLCLERKVQLTTIAGMTGHKKIDTIMQHYANKHLNKQTALDEVFEM